MLNALIVAKKGAVREGLEALLASIPDLVLTSTTDSLHAAVEHAIKLFPDLVVIDSAYPNSSVRCTVAEMKECCPGIFLLILVHDESGRNVAADFGADYVAMSGIRADELASIFGGRLMRPSN